MVPDQALLDAMRNRVVSAPVSGVRFVGVDGPSGAGKSTFAGPLAAVFDAPVIEAFFEEDRTRERADFVVSTAVA
jgi:uridine kinase